MYDVFFFLHPASGSFSQFTVEIVLVILSGVTGSLNASLWSQNHRAQSIPLYLVACFHGQEAKPYVSTPRKALGKIPGIDLEAWNWRSPIINHTENDGPLSSNSKCKTKLFSFRFSLGVKCLANKMIMFGLIKLCFSWLDVLMSALGWYYSLSLHVALLLPHPACL